MPFTPIHMGPGILIKSLLRGSFSLMVFGWAQIVMDVQPLLVMLTGEGHLHGFSHTYLGASILAVMAAWSGKYLSQLGLWLLRIESSWRQPIPWRVAFISAFIGSYIHVLLDSIMHADVKPFYPWSLDNALWRWISVEQLHRFCLYTGVLGGVVFYSVSYYKKHG